MFGTTQRPLVWQLVGIFVTHFVTHLHCMKRPDLWYLRPCWKITTQTFNLKAAPGFARPSSVWAHCTCCMPGNDDETDATFFHYHGSKAGLIDNELLRKSTWNQEIYKMSLVHIIQHTILKARPGINVCIVIHGSQVYCWPANQGCVKHVVSFCKIPS